MMKPQVSTLFFDMNSFFASVWQAEESQLRGKPVGVVTVDAPGAALIAASAEAKRAGLKNFMRVGEARQRCPDLIIREALHDMFVDYHHRIHAAVETVLPIDRTHSVDEFSCRLTGSQQALDRALALGRAVQEAIHQQVSPALHCSVGVAPNKLLAKIAAGLKKPAVDWLHPDVLPGKIAHLTLDDLPGVSRGILPRLERAGIRNVTDLHALDPKAARHLWRNVEGERFLRQLQGEAVVYPETKRHSLGHGQQLTPQNRTPEGARLVARRLLVKAASRLRRERLFARSLHVSARCAERGRASTDGQISATQDSFSLLETFDRYWARLRIDAPTSVSVMLGGLIETERQEGDLFSARPAGAQTGREGLCSAIDALNAKFGQDTVQFGELPPHKVAYTGAKIAFGRIPDVAEFNE
ncbi:DNA polymerase IV [Pontivivens insulae]|uniref:DNA-directed DNA polymerase n=2 Tax=Pontivivens insulae TaxID=1639689 RepID=A0A2R8ADR2_9RHOB|nr:DNA polymerase-4 [Pontivivens insulae]SPF30359.1 DNA polymerase IV [Pontivivens insulae]